MGNLIKNNFAFSQTCGNLSAITPLIQKFYLPFLFAISLEHCKHTYTCNAQHTQNNLCEILCQQKPWMEITLICDIQYNSRIVFFYQGKDNSLFARYRQQFSLVTDCSTNSSFQTSLINKICYIISNDLFSQAV